MNRHMPEPRGEGSQRTSWSVGRERARGSERLEAFSDAVIAVMLTLLAFQLLAFDPRAIERAGLLQTLPAAVVSAQHFCASRKPVTTC
jgi:uncharacterized membrane protein